MEIDVLIFDVDGILINVSQSYRNAIRETVPLYLNKCLGFSEYHPNLITHDEVTAFKLVGGFNNDWDLTTALLKYFLSLIENQSIPSISSPINSVEIINYLQEQIQNINTSMTELNEKKDIFSFTEELKKVGTGLDAVWQILGTKNDHLLWHTGEVITTNLVQRIFQEIYLGRDLFVQLYNEEPLIYTNEGLIDNETLIMNPEILEKLADKIPLGIATGRPKEEAYYTLENVGILSYFQAIITHSDKEKREAKILAETGKKLSLGKPHPFTLLESVKKITENKEVKCAYIGDLPDDVRAANAAKKERKFTSIGCLFVAEDQEIMRQEFEKVGADIILNHPDELGDLFVN